MSTFDELAQLPHLELKAKKKHSFPLHVGAATGIFVSRGGSGDDGGGGREVTNIPIFLNILNIPNLPIWDLEHKRP